LGPEGERNLEPVSLDDVVCRHPDHVAADMDGEVMMMNIDTGKYFALNDVASFIWAKLVQPLSLRRICEFVQAEFDVTSDDCERDTKVFVQTMVRDGLLQLASATANAEKSR
jgi:hypothetical protein